MQPVWLAWTTLAVAILVLPASAGYATCMQICRADLMTERCVVHRHWSPGRPVSFVGSCETCCAAGGVSVGCTKKDLAPLEGIVLATESGAVVAKGPRTIGRCQNADLLAFEVLLEPGRYALVGASGFGVSFDVVAPKGWKPTLDLRARAVLDRVKNDSCDPECAARRDEALRDAIRAHRADLVRELLAERRGTSADTELLDLAVDVDARAGLVSLLLEKLVLPESDGNAFRSRLLIRAADRGRSGAVAALRAAGVTPDHEIELDSEIASPLILAATAGDTRRMRFLLDLGANPDWSPDPRSADFGVTPLSAARRHQRTAAIRLLESLRAEEPCALAARIREPTLVEVDGRPKELERGERVIVTAGKGDRLRVSSPRDAPISFTAWVYARGLGPELAGAGGLLVPSPSQNGKGKPPWLPLVMTGCSGYFARVDDGRGRSGWIEAEHVTIR